ncbi:MAG: DUF4274 domain-containing protein [Polyangiaceae bacterium]
MESPSDTFREMPFDEDEEDEDDRRRKREYARSAEVYEALEPDDRAFVDALARAGSRYYPDLTMHGLLRAGSKVHAGRFVELALPYGKTPSVLDLRKLTALESFVSLSGHVTEVVDARGLRKLRRLSLRGERLRRVRLRDNPALERLVCVEGQVRRLPLDQVPQLRELNCSNLPLEELELPEGLESLECEGLELTRVPLVPSLKHLNCSDNELKDIDLSQVPRLEILNASRNQIRKLEPRLCPRLIGLGLTNNRLSKLDLSANPRLVILEVAMNRLKELTVSHQRLIELDCSDNDLKELDVRHCPRLCRLDCSDNDIRQLGLGAHPNLFSLVAASNPLYSLDLSGLPGLVVLMLGGNPQLRRLDITPCWQLADLFLSWGDREMPVPRKRVVATDEQRKRLPALWRIPPWSVNMPGIRGLNRYTLHHSVEFIEWDGGSEDLLRVIQDPKCDLGTALLVYWRGGAGYWAQFASREEISRFQHAGWDLAHEIEQRVARGAYKTAVIPYEPRCDAGIDRTTLYADQPQQRRLPEVMFQRSVDGPSPRVRYTRLLEMLDWGLRVIPKDWRVKPHMLL